MNKVINILSAFCLGMTVVACNSDSDVEVVPATEIQNLTFNTTPGNIELSWEYASEENNNRYVEIRYFDPAKKKDVMKTVNGKQTSFVIEDTRKKYGEYKFKVCPYSVSFTPGAVYETSGTSEAAPAQESYTSSEMELTVEDLALFGKKPDGSFLTNPVGDSNVLANLLDGKLNTRLGCAYSGVPNGTIFYFTVNLPKPQQYLKFSYNTPHAGQCPTEIQCLVKNKVDDEWTLLTTLTKEADGLPVDNSGSLYTSKEIKSPFEFNYFCFRVTGIDKNKVNFSLAEFRIYDVEYSYYDPEAQEE